MKRFAMYVFAGLFMAAGITLQSAKADEWNRQTTLTVNTPVSIQGVVLLPGKYTIQLGPSNTTRSIVQIFADNNYHLVTTLLCNESIRLKTPSKTVLNYYETSPGAAAAIRSWYYPGLNTGIHFKPPARLASSGVSISNSAAVSATVVGE